MANSVIELNGKRYDAITGAYLGAGDTAGAKKHPASKGRAIDGFMRPGQAAKPAVTAAAAPAKVPRKVMEIVQPAAGRKAVTVAPHPTAASHRHTAAQPAPKPLAKPASAMHAKAAVAPARAAVHHTPVQLPHAAPAQAHPATPAPAKKPTPAAGHAPHAAATARAHQPEHSHTLMRRVVHKPQTTIKPAIKPQAPIEIAATPLSALFKPSVSQIDPARLERAKQIARHAGVRRFMPVIPDNTPAAVETTPLLAHHVPLIPVQAAPARAHHPKRTHTDIFENALAHASSHQQPKHKLRPARHRRLVNTLAVIGTLLVIGGFVTYLNIPNIQVHVASIQAGFKADLPSYKPTGYALTGGVKRTGNTVSMTFRSGENSFVVTQQPSDWNSQTLVENTLALSGDNHKTIDAGGRTVYIYSGSNAVWVNGGIRYDINTSAPLTTDDLAQLASSM